MSTAGKDRRRVKLIKPSFQLKLIGVFVGLSGLGFMLQSVHVGLRLSELAASAPEGGPYLMAVMPELPLEILAISFGMFLPLTAAIGIIVTFRIAGPIHRLEEFLRGVIDGKQIGPCKLRKNDELQELCELVNEATKSVRIQLTETPPESVPERKEEFRAAG